MIYPSVRERGRLNTKSGDPRSKWNSRLSRLMIGFASIFLLGATGAEAATYYVTQSGSGSANGSSASNAWSVSAFNSSTVPTGGDTVYFSGTISSNVKPNKSGTGNGASRLTLDFSGATLTSANPRISIVGKAYLNVNGGTMGSTTSEDCISFGGSQSHDITIQNWKQTASETNTGAFIVGQYCYNLLVANNNLTNTRCLIQSDSILSHDITIANNYAMTSLNTTAQTDIIFLGDAYNVTIEGNKLVHRTQGAATLRHNDVIQCYKKGGSNAGNPGGWIIRYNWIETNVNGGSGDSSWCMLQHMNNYNGKDALQIYGNVFYGTPTATGVNNGVAVAYNVDGAVFRFYNNTVVRKNDPDNTIRFDAPGTLYAQNNIGYAPNANMGTYIRWGMTAGKWANNWFYNFKATSANTGTNGGTSDPQFVDYTNNNFTVKSTSPVIGKGDSTINSSAQYSKGIAPGATWPNPTLATRAPGDVGAFASGSTVTPIPPPTDTTAPSITGVTAAPTATGATITWTTNEPANSSVNYGASTSYGSVLSDASLGTAHSVTINGLTAGTTYHYRVQSTDAAGNVAKSADGTFTTAAQAGQLTAQPTSLSFGQVTVGSSSDLTLTLKNTGGTSISGTASVAAPFSIVSGGSYTIAASQSQAITVRYSPTAASANSGTVTLTGGNGVTVPVSGTGASSSTGGGSSSLTAEAESGTLSGPFVSSNGAISQSVQTTDVASSGRASFKMNVPEAGQYSVVVSLSAPNTASNSLFFNIDAEPVDPTMVWDIPVTTSAFENRTGAWRGTGTVDQPELSPKYFDLTAGTHELIIRGREAGVKIDKVSLVKKAVTIPVIEAESGTITSPFVVSSGTVSQSTLTTTVSSAGRASYKINVPEAGQYAVVVALAATSTASNSLFFNIDAEPVDPTMVWDIPVTSGVENRTGAWRGTGTVDLPELSPKYFDLTAGTHELIIRGREAGVKLDKITLVKRPSTPEVTSVQ